MGGRMSRVGQRSARMPSDADRLQFAVRFATERVRTAEAQPGAARVGELSGGHKTGQLTRRGDSGFGSSRSGEVIPVRRSPGTKYFNSNEKRAGSFKERLRATAVSPS